MESHWTFFIKNVLELIFFITKIVILIQYTNPKEPILNGIESANCMLQSLFAVADAKLLVC